ncbi:COR domain-containing protein [uncultured Psychroserpens sp.]|uniref:leucine-rich repeat domain-containing protein n=1 Tax=uncultured Psychroserpens sp. TaxID=255436 RepID=UPI0026214357|nr:COR domain-containing protein [uncultured Psychroserpens sp.]
MSWQQALIEDKKQIKKRQGIIFTMNKFKCNLYVLGSPGVGKTFLIKIIEEFTQINNQLKKDIQKETDWIIRTKTDEINVEIKEKRNIDLVAKELNDKKVKNFIIYIVEAKKNGLNPVINSNHIEQLKILSKKSKIIVGYHFGFDHFDRKVSHSPIKKYFPFVEYFLPINGLNFREYEGLYQLGPVLRQIIINSLSNSLEYAKGLIKSNFETKELTLDLGNCGLTSLNDIKELFNNTHLKTLILSNEWGEYLNGAWVRKTSNNKLDSNVLFSFPSELKYLKNLEVLISGGNWKNSYRSKRSFISNWSITDIKPLSNLRKLSILNISNNEINAVSPLSRLSNLTKLYLNNNCISRFSTINKFPNLNELYLSNNKIKSLIFLSSESNIQTIDLHSNQITDLSPIKNLISRIDIKDSRWENNTISIASNPLSIPPAEIVAKGKKSVMTYFSKLESEKEIQIEPYINGDIKLIMVGNSNVGKSTYVNWLKTEKVNKKIATTDWLDFGIWKAQKNSKSYNVRIFDFGGQEYYHDTHHLFFTNRTAYILLWESSSNYFDELEINQLQSDGNKKKVKIETFPIEYWLDSIRYHTQKRKLTQVEKSITKILDERDQQIEESVLSNTEWTKHVLESTNKLSKPIEDEENILVLQNKADSKELKSFLNEASIRINYPKIYDFDQVSVYNNKRLDLSKDMLFDIFDSLDVLNRQYLGTWNYIKQDIEKREFKNHFSMDDFLKYCNSIIEKIPELKGKSQKQKNTIIFNKEDALVFANFLADIGLCLYYPESKTLNKKVFLNQNQILKDLNQVLLKINKSTGEIKKSEIISALGKNESSSEVSDLINLMLHFKILFKHPLELKKSFVAPLYLPQNPPQSIRIFNSLFKRPVYRFQYETFIHKSVILDFFAAYGSKAFSETNDDSLFYFWRNGIVIKDESTNEIVMVKFIPGNNKSKSAYLDIYAVNNTDDKFIKTIVDYIDSINQGIKVKKLVPVENSTEYIPLETIYQNEKNNNLVFYYDKKIYRLTEFKKHLNTPMKMKKIFISYSKQDLRLVNKFIEHLSALKRDGKVSHWYCSELEAGSVWSDEIQKNLMESDIICFMISPNFMKTDYIHEHEIKKAFERKEEDPSFKIVPIILNFCRWTTTKNNLGSFTGLPYTAKPVMDFDNQDMAWYIVEECLRLMIEDDLNPIGDDFYNDKLPGDVLKLYTRIIEGKVDKNTD